MYTSKIFGRTLLGVWIASALVACSSSDYNPPPAPMPQAPQIQGLTDQSLPQDTTSGLLAFEVIDRDSGADRVVLSAESSDTNVIAADGIALGGSGAARTIQITPTPETIGSAMITVRAVDPGGLATQQTFKVQVDGVFVSFRDTLKQVFAVDDTGDQRTLVGITFTQDIDDDLAAFDELL